MEDGCIETERITLQKRRLTTSTMLSNELTDEIQEFVRQKAEKEGKICLHDVFVHFPWLESIIVNHPISTISASVWARTEGVYDFEWYASWWQELRERLLPSWWLDRRPSRREVKYSVTAMSKYPTLCIDKREHEAILDFIEGKWPE